MDFPSLGFEHVLDEVAKQREAWLRARIPGHSVIHIVVLSSGKNFHCIYKRHDKETITVEVPRLAENCAVLIRNRQEVVSQEETFKFVDIEIR